MSEAARAPDQFESALDATKLAAARLWAGNQFPYLASAVFASPVLAAPGLGRLVIDRWWRVHADPDVVARAEVAQLGGELLHLCAHVLRDHAQRADRIGLGQAAELHHWVDAADAEITDDFPTGLARVSSPLSPAELDCPPARLAEEYYRSGSVREGSVNDCGSGAHGRSASWEPPPPSAGESTGISAHHQDLIRQRVADDVSRAEAQAVTAGLRHWAEQHRRPPVNWRHELAATVRRSVATIGGAVDYSYRRPSRRAGTVPGVILPALRQPSVEVAVVCDTSASVSDELLSQAVAEIDGLLRATGTRSVRVLACDDAVHTVSRVTHGRDVTLVGGGGTDLGVGMAAAMSQRPAPQVLIVLTDGFTPWPDHAPPADVIVGLLSSEADRIPGLQAVDPPQWARAIRISSGGRQ